LLISYREGQIALDQDMLKWKIKILPSAMKEVHKRAFRVIRQTESSLEKVKEKMNKATRAVEDVQMSETLLSNKEKIIKVINDVLQQKEEKKKKKFFVQLSSSSSQKKRRSRRSSLSLSSSSSRLLLSLSVNMKKKKKSLNKEEEKKFSQSSQRQRQQQQPKKQQFLPHIRCFKCGERGHRISECSSPQFKCFNYEGFGHLAKDCKKLMKKHKHSFYYQKKDKKDSQSN
jgi:hypothetical protein